MFTFTRIALESVAYVERETDRHSNTSHLPHSTYTLFSSAAANESTTRKVKRKRTKYDLKEIPTRRSNPTYINNICIASILKMRRCCSPMFNAFWTRYRHHYTYHWQHLCSFCRFFLSILLCSLRCWSRHFTVLLPESYFLFVRLLFLFASFNTFNSIWRYVLLTTLIVYCILICLRHFLKLIFFPHISHSFFIL